LRAGGRVVVEAGEDVAGERGSRGAGEKNQRIARWRFSPDRLTSFVMAYVDPERFKRFQSFLRTHIGAFAKAANQEYKDHGPGVLLYRAPDDQFDKPVREFRFEYKTKAGIEAAQADNRDDLIQGML